MPPAAKNRVCDRCIRKKVKCDLQRPNCSRCSEAGLPCTYSAERKKPGPPRGSRRQKDGSTSMNSGTVGAQVTVGGQSDTFPVLNQDTLVHGSDSKSLDMTEGLCLPQGEGLEFGNMMSLQGNIYDMVTPVVYRENQDILPGYSLSHEHERELLVQFFNEVHPAIPLFRIQPFLNRYDAGLVGRDLLVTVVTVAAKVLSPISFWTAEDIELCIKFLLEKASPETAAPGTHNALDSFRQECLLAYYEFHQFPGSSSWMRISRLARRAYSVGVNQIDNPDLCSAFDRATATEDEIEEWRYLFWCIYCLDSYSNISVGTPFVVELESINTALPRIPHNQVDDPPAPLPKIFLPDDIEEVWKTAKEVISNGAMVDLNLHLVTTTILRQAGYIMRLRSEGKRLPTKIEALRRALPALRLSLPPRYLNPARNILSGESCIDHHIRLTNIILLQMIHLLVALSAKYDWNETEFMRCWLETLEPCQNIVSVVEQWDNQHSPRIDPAICLIVYTALCFLELHRRSNTDPTAPILASLDRGQHLLVLFLEQFSSIWTVPRFLICQFQKTQKQYGDDSLTYAELGRILSKVKTPLHPKVMEQSARITATTPDINTNADIGMHLDEFLYFDHYDHGP